MKINIYLALPLLVLAAACSSGEQSSESATEVVAQEATEQTSAPTLKKYGVKSGVITYEVKMESAYEIEPEKKVLYFDDYGMKEREDTYEGENLVSSFFSDGTDLYLLMYADKSAYNRGKAHRGIAYRFDWNEIPEEDRSSGKFFKGEPTVIAGKTCEVYSYKKGDSEGKFAGYNNICLLTEATAYGMKSITTAVSFEENANVPAETFKVPEGFTLK